MFCLKTFVTDANHFFMVKLSPSMGCAFNENFLPSISVYAGPDRTFSRCYFLETSCWLKGGGVNAAKNRSELIGTLSTFGQFVGVDGRFLFFKA